VKKLLSESELRNLVQKLISEADESMSATEFLSKLTKFTSRPDWMEKVVGFFGGDPTSGEVTIAFGGKNMTFKIMKDEQRLVALLNPPFVVGNPIPETEFEGIGTRLASGKILSQERFNVIKPQLKRSDAEAVKASNRLFYDKIDPDRRANGILVQYGEGSNLPNKIMIAYGARVFAEIIEAAVKEEKINPPAVEVEI
jgi:hypothetical protein